MEIERFIAGWFTAAPGIWRRGDDMDTAVRFPVPVYLITTESERVLVDTGIHPDLASDESLAHFRPEPGDALDVADVTKIVLTHLHFDHASGLALLPRDVPVFVQRAEWEGGHDDDAIQRNFLRPADYACAADQVVLVDGDHDLLGDGSVMLLSTPGHTPGHQSVQIGDVVIGGDVTHYPSGLDDHRFPVFGDDFDAQARSAERLRALRDGGAVVTPGHDPEVIVAGRVHSSDGDDRVVRGRP